MSENKISENRDKPTLEESFARIETILEQMDKPETSLEEAFGLYQQGVGELKTCNVILDEVAKKMQILNADGELEEL